MSWNIVKFNHRLQEAELLKSDFGNTSKYNVQFEAESRLIDHIYDHDGKNRSIDSMMIKRSDLPEISESLTTSQHYIIGESNPWRLTLHKVEISYIPRKVLVKEKIFKTEEYEVEVEVEIEKPTITKGWFGRQHAGTVKTKNLEKRILNRVVEAEVEIEKLEFNKVIHNRDVFTMSLVYDSNYIIQPADTSRNNKESVLYFVNLIKNSNVLKHIRENNDMVNVSSLILYYPEEFGWFDKNSTIKFAVPKKVNPIYEIKPSIIPKSQSNPFINFNELFNIREKILGTSHSKPITIIKSIETDEEKHLLSSSSDEDDSSSSSSDNEDTEVEYVPDVYETFHTGAAEYIEITSMASSSSSDDDENEDENEDDEDEDEYDEDSSDDEDDDANDEYSSEDLSDLQKVLDDIVNDINKN